MLTAIQDRDTIFSRAIEIASPEERDAYIAQACGQDGVLKRQVEERIAAHFQANNGPDIPIVVAANGPVPPGPVLEQRDTPQAHSREEPRKTLSEKNERRKYPPALVTTITMLALATSAAAISLSVWGIRTQGAARRTMKKAEEAQEHCAER